MREEREKKGKGKRGSCGTGAAGALKKLNLQISASETNPLQRPGMGQLDYVDNAIKKEVTEEGGSYAGGQTISRAQSINQASAAAKATERLYAGDKSAANATAGRQAARAAMNPAALESEKETESTTTGRGSCTTKL